MKELEGGPLDERELEGGPLDERELEGGPLDERELEGGPLDDSFQIRENVMEWTDLYLNYSICVTMLLILHHNSLFGACNTSPCITPNHYEMVDVRCKCGRNWDFLCAYIIH